MKEAKLVRKDFANVVERQEPVAENAANEIRVLDEMELVLAGGGDQGDNWP